MQIRTLIVPLGLVCTLAAAAAAADDRTPANRPAKSDGAGTNASKKQQAEPRSSGARDDAKAGARTASQRDRTRSDPADHREGGGRKRELPQIQP
jgi:hypothetical protein